MTNQRDDVSPAFRWRVCEGEWPAWRVETPASAAPDGFKDFAKYYQAAIDSLARTVVPRPTAGVDAEEQP